MLVFQLTIEVKIEVIEMGQTVTCDKLKICCSVTRERVTTSDLIYPETHLQHTTTVG